MQVTSACIAGIQVAPCGDLPSPAFDLIHRVQERQRQRQLRREAIRARLDACRTM